MAEVPYTLPDEQLVEVYNWIDGITFSRRRKDISRDFSDGVLCAELIAKFLPRIVDLHNYTPCSRAQQKTTNWNTLNRKVLAKLGIVISAPTVKKLVESTPGTIEQILWDLKYHVEEAVRTNLHVCPSSTPSNAVSISVRPPTAKLIGESQSVSAISGEMQPKRQQSVSKQSIKLQKKAQQQMSTSSIPSKSSPSDQNENLDGEKFQPAPVSLQGQPSPATDQVGSVPEVENPISPDQLSPQSGPALKEYKILPLSNVNSVDDCTTSADEENDSCFGDDLINVDDLTEIFDDPTKVAKRLEEKDKQIEFLQSEIVCLNMQSRRYKTLVAIKDRRIDELILRISAITGRQE